MSGGSIPKQQQAQPVAATPVTPVPDPKKKLRKGVEKTPNILTGPSGSLGRAETQKNKLGL
jgi:hypothetical protein